MIMAVVPHFCPSSAHTKAQTPPFFCWHENTAQALFHFIYSPHVFDAPAALYAALGIRFQHVSSFMMAGFVLTWGANGVDLFMLLHILVLPRSP